MLKTTAIPEIRTKTFAVEAQEQVSGDAEMALINRYALVDLTPEQVFAGKMHLANTKVDRTHEKFTPAVLGRFAETLPGKSVLQGHDHGSLPVGRFYAAGVETHGDHSVLVAKYFMLNADALTAKVKAGIAGHVSIGFKADARMCDLCGKDYDRIKTVSSRNVADEEGEPCKHIAGREYDGTLCSLTYGGRIEKYEAVEGSLVWLGAQYDAETAKAEQELIVAKEAWSSVAPQEERMEIKEALVEIDRLKAECAELKSEAAAGKAYRDHLTSEITRLANATKNDAMAPVLLAMAATTPIPQLEEVVKGLNASFDAMFPPTGKGAVEPPAGTPTAGERKFDPSRPSATWRNN